MRTRIIIGTLCIIGLLCVFLFQRIDIAAIVGIDASIKRFIFNRTVRFIVNDALAIGLIYALFNERKYVVFSIYVQLAGTILFLIPYFILKLFYPGYNGPMINFLHRLILNPMLMMVLIVAFYYQKNKIKSG